MLVKQMEVGIHERFDILERKIDEIKSIQRRLLSKICTKLDAMVTFTMEHKYPRLPFLTSREKQSLRHPKVTHMVPGMTSFVVQLFCEHRDQWFPYRPRSRRVRSIIWHGSNKKVYERRQMGAFHIYSSGKSGCTSWELAWVQ